jgi:hypothetical protein
MHSSCSVVCVWLPHAQLVVAVEVEVAHGADGGAETTKVTGTVQNLPLAEILKRKIILLI